MYIPSWGEKIQSKITAMQTAFSFGGTINANNRHNIVPAKEHALGTAVILDIFFLRRRCPGQSIIVEGLKIGMKVQSDRVICT